MKKLISTKVQSSSVNVPFSCPNKIPLLRRGDEGNSRPVKCRTGWSAFPPNWHTKYISPSTTVSTVIPAQTDFTTNLYLFPLLLVWQSQSCSYSSCCSVSHFSLWIGVFPLLLVAGCWSFAFQEICSPVREMGANRKPAACECAGRGGEVTKCLRTVSQ